MSQAGSGTDTSGEWMGAVPSSWAGPSGTACSLHLLVSVQKISEIPVFALEPGSEVAEAPAGRDQGREALLL